MLRLPDVALNFFLLGFSFIDTGDSQDSRERGGDHLLSLSTTSVCLRTFRHLFATFHVRWLPRVFNRTACTRLLPMTFTTLLSDRTLIYDCLLGDVLLGFLLKLDSHLPKKKIKNICFNDRPFKNDAKCFLFHLKSSFRSQDIQVFVLTVLACRKKA